MDPKKLFTQGKPRILVQLQREAEANQDRLTAGQIEPLIPLYASDPQLPLDGIAAEAVRKYFDRVIRQAQQGPQGED